MKKKRNINNDLTIWLCHNTEFVATTVLFDEITFSKCPDKKRREYTWVDNNYTQDNPVVNQLQTSLEDDNSLYAPIKNPKNKEPHHNNDKNKNKILGNDKQPTIPSQPILYQNQGHKYHKDPLPLECNQYPQRTWNTVVWPSNIYGKTRKPINIERDIY